MVTGGEVLQRSYAGCPSGKLFASTDGAHVEQASRALGRATPPPSTRQAGSSRPRRTPSCRQMQDGLGVHRAILLRQRRPPHRRRRCRSSRRRSVAGARASDPQSEQLWFPTIHESIGHPTELDRRLAMRPTSPDFVCHRPTSSASCAWRRCTLSVYADKTTPALASCGYDDDGVKTQRWDLVRDGLFVGYQTTREQGVDRRAGLPRNKLRRRLKSFPFQRMPNVSLQPGKKGS